MRAQPVQIHMATLTAAGQGKDKELITEYSNVDAKSDLDGRTFGGVTVHKNMNVKGLRENESRENGDSKYRLPFGGHLLQRGAGMSGRSWWES